MNTKSIVLHLSFTVISLWLCQSVLAQKVPLDQEPLVHLLNQELSGESAKRNVEYIARLHRMRGSEDYNKAVAFITGKLKEYQLEDIELIRIPADGKAMYGTQKSRPAWNVDFAELWEMKQQDGKWTPTIKIADWESIPMVVAQDSHSGEAEAELIDIGAGNKPEDYEGKAVRGKLVLTSLQPSAVVPLAIKKHGAAGIISYAQNQVTAWWKENENLVRWGHLETFSDTPTFAFMVSLKQARNFQERLAMGESIRLHAKVEARQEAGSYDILSARIEGSDPDVKHEEIVFTCHLDHPRPGANDNASGCMAILEVARTLKKLILENKIERPRRSIRFIWSPEIEGTTALLNFQPEIAENTKFNIHMDMVGGGPETKATFHVSRSPSSLPSFVNDVGEALGAFLNQSSDAYSSGQSVPYPIVSKEGGKEALHAVLGQFHMGSDFQVFSEGAFRIPSIYLHDWPDRYIHTNYDHAGNIDPTKMKRSSFIGAAAAYYLADLSERDLPVLTELMKRNVLSRAARMLEYGESLAADDRENLKYYFWQKEMEAFNSLLPFVNLSIDIQKAYNRYLNELKNTIGAGKKAVAAHVDAGQIYVRNEAIKGPMSVFGYNYFNDHYDSAKKRPSLLSFSGLRGGGGQYSYEALNLVNGKNDVLEIRNQLSAEFGPIPIEYVAEYLRALESIEVIKQP